MMDKEQLANNGGGSEYDRLFYPFLFDGGTSNTDDVLSQVRHSTIEKCKEVVALRQSILHSSRDKIVAAGMDMASAFSQGATLWAFGNGGSATDAQDIVADLACPPDSGSVEPDNPRSPRPLPAIALTNDIAVVTAVANDVGFDNVYSRQIIAFGRPGDIAFGISTSGTSASVLVALEQAKKLGLLTIALAGYDGGKMLRSPAVDHCIIAPSDHTPRIQEGHATIYHALLDVIWSLISNQPSITPNGGAQP